MDWIHILLLFIRGILRNRTELAAENLALRQQLAILREQKKLPRLRTRDRIFWVWLSRLWAGWRSLLVIVQPDTVVRWHRQGFRLYWRWKWRAKSGRPKVEVEIRKLIQRFWTRVFRPKTAFSTWIRFLGGTTGSALSTARNRSVAHGFQSAESCTVNEQGQPDAA